MLYIFVLYNIIIIVNICVKFTSSQLCAVLLSLNPRNSSVVGSGSITPFHRWSHWGADSQYRSQHHGASLWEAQAVCPPSHCVTLSLSREETLFHKAFQVIPCLNRTIRYSREGGVSFFLCVPRCRPSKYFVLLIFVLKKGFLVQNNFTLQKESKDRTEGSRRCCSRLSRMLTFYLTLIHLSRQNYPWHITTN